MVSFEFVSVPSKAIGERRWGARSHRSLKIIDIETFFPQDLLVPVAGQTCHRVVESELTALQLPHSQHWYFGLKI